MQLELKGYSGTTTKIHLLVMFYNLLEIISFPLRVFGYCRNEGAKTLVGRIVNVLVAVVLTSLSFVLVAGFYFYCVAEPSELLQYGIDAKSAYYGLVIGLIFIIYSLSGLISSFTKAKK